MRIAIAGQAYFQEDNGQAVFTVRLARGLAGCGHQVLLFAPSRSGRSAMEQQGNLLLTSVPAVHLAHNANFSYFSSQLAHRVLAEFLPDLLHIQDHYFLSRAVFRQARRLAIPALGSNHFLPPNLTDNLRIPLPLRGPVHRLLWLHMKSLYNQLLAISTPTPTGAALLREQKLRPPITAISCGVDPHRFQPPLPEQRLATRSRYGMAPDKKILLYIGRIDREKGLDTMVRALAALRDESVDFFIGGKGSYRNDLEKMVRQLGLKRQVRFPGFIPAEDLPLFLGAGDCFVMAGHAELQSIATLEAMACGLPVLAADAGALPELVRPGENGELFSPGDVPAAQAALGRMLTREKEWPAMGRDSRELARGHNLEKTVTTYLAWYHTHLQRLRTK